MREQRLVFGEAAELYDRARASYPDSVIADVFDFASSGSGVGRALEVGAGTGKATVSFADRGVEIVALEPDPAMAAVAKRNCQHFPNVSIETVSFEEWRPESAGFDLVFSAQAWHWVRPEVRYINASESLRPNGTLALFWHRFQWSDDDPVRQELDDLYRTTAPELYARRPGFPGLTPLHFDDYMIGEVTATERFTDVQARFHPWSATFDGPGFIDLLATQSDHRLLSEADRASLFESVGQIVSDHGGQITIPHETFLLLARHRSAGDQ